MKHFLLQCPTSTLNILLYALGSPPWPWPMPTHPPGGLSRRPPLLATCCPLPYLCLLEEDRPAITPVIPTEDYPGFIRIHRSSRPPLDPYEPWDRVVLHYTKGRRGHETDVRGASEHRACCGPERASDG
ncbi:hypothetical protein E2C01_102175 [Portunus trituberculatus]|uniref:Uncharacterized protein n=1 Tax=Portunus trituberculatus TaxID=210409 RepID=A0A5B7KHV5_PORTR|nr:hypothetical protein [Portunus trituberculatus]